MGERKIAAGGRGFDHELLRAIAQEVGVSLDSSQLDLFAGYALLIIEWNRRLNLTRIDEPARIAVEHFADSLACLQAVPGRCPAVGERPAADEGPAPDESSGGGAPALRCVDVGSGVGLPGLALKIACPDWQVTLVEAIAKKAEFVRRVVANLELESVLVRRSRAESVGRDLEHRESYDLAVARAVAPLAVLGEYMLPLLKPGGKMIAMKGSAISEEVADAKRAIEVMGGGNLRLVEYELPGLDSPRLLVVVEKTGPTPDKYPRRPGLPAKRPLR